MADRASTLASTKREAVAAAVSIADAWSRRSAQACTLLIDKLELSLEPSFRAYVVECFMEHHSSDLVVELNRLPIFAAVSAHRLVYAASEAEFSAVVGLISRAASGSEPAAELHTLADDLINRGRHGVTNRVASIIRGAIFAAEHPAIPRRLRVEDRPAAFA